MEVSWTLALNHLTVEHDRSTNHRYGPELRPMILLCEHPAVGGGAKVENRFLVFQARQRVFCTVAAGCESAQSTPAV